MSWFGSNKNGEHNAYNKPGLGKLDHVHRPVIIDHNDVKHPVAGFGYEKRHNFEQHMARTEEVVKYGRFPGMADEEYIPSKTEYGTWHQSGKKDESSTKSHDERVRGPIKDSPWDNMFRFNSPPSKDHRHTTYDYDEHRNLHVNNTKETRPNNMKDQKYYDDEKNKRIGFTKQGPRPNYLRDQEDYNEHVNPKTNGYSPPKHYVQSIHQDDKGKGNDYATRARTGPFGTPPRNERSYETSNFKPVANGPPQFNPQPKKEQRNYNQETIENTEASRQYGKGVPGAGPRSFAKDKYNSGRTIDCKEAAEKYNGVLMTN